MSENKKKDWEWKKKIVKKEYKKKDGETFIFERVYWEKVKQAKGKGMPRKKKKIPIIERPVKPSSPKTIRRKKKPQNDVNDSSSHL